MRKCGILPLCTTVTKTKRCILMSFVTAGKLARFYKAFFVITDRIQLLLRYGLLIVCEYYIGYFT